MFRPRCFLLVGKSLAPTPSRTANNSLFDCPVFGVHFTLQRAILYRGLGFLCMTIKFDEQKRGIPRDYSALSAALDNCSLPHGKLLASQHRLLNMHASKTGWTRTPHDPIGSDFM
jgi:hypothetical protein